MDEVLAVEEEEGVLGFEVVRVVLVGADYAAVVVGPVEVGLAERVSVVECYVIHCETISPARIKSYCILAISGGVKKRRERGGRGKGYGPSIIQMSQLLLIAVLTTALLVRRVAADAHGCPSSQYYSSNSSQCLGCPPACAACTSSNACSQCSSGYFSAGNGTCPACSVANCAICPNNVCAFCSSRYELTGQQTCALLNNSVFMAYLIGAATLGIILFLACCCYCVNRCRDRAALASLHRSAQLQRRAEAEAPSQQEMQLDETWKEDEEFSQKKDETCPFCLEALVNLELPCRHLYHIGCIAQWLGKHGECPVCKRSVAGEAKLYCSECFSCDIKFDAALITSHKVLEKRICQRCTLSQQIIQIE